MYIYIYIYIYIYTYIHTYRVINDVTTTIVVSGVILFVITAWITIHFGRNPRNTGSPPRDSSDVKIMKFISVASLIVVTVWLINYAHDSLIVDTRVSANVE